MSGECNVCGGLGCVESRHKWKIKYKYINPSGAGPFKGSMIIKGDKPLSGQEIYAAFGLANITSWKGI